MNSIKKWASERGAVTFMMLCCLIFYFFSYFQRIAVPGTIFNDLQSSYHASATAITGLGSAFVVIYALDQLFMGLLVDKFGGIRIILAGGLMLCLGSFLFPISTNLPMLFLSRAITGLGSGAIYLSLIKETDRAFPKNFSVMVGFVFLAGYTGGTCGTMPFERLSTLFGWREVLLAVAGLSTLTLIGIAASSRFVKLPSAGSLKISVKPYLLIVRNRQTLRLFFAGASSFGIYFTVQSVLGKKFLEDFAGIGSYQASMITFWMMVFTTFMMFTAGSVSRLFGNRRKMFVIGGAAFSSGGLILMIFGILTGIRGIYFLICFLMLAAASGMTVIFMSTIREVNPKPFTALSVGCYNFGGYIFTAALSNLAGMILDLFRSAAKVSEHSTVYPDRAYFWVFAALLIPALTGLWLTFGVRETRGENIHLKLNAERRRRLKKSV